MFRKLLPNEPLNAYVYFLKQKLTRVFFFKLPSNVGLILSSQYTRRFFEAVHFCLILEETAIVILLKCLRIYVWLKLTQFKFSPPIVIKTDTIVIKSAGVILILFTTATNLWSLRKSAVKKQWYTCFDNTLVRTFLEKFSKWCHIQIWIARITKGNVRNFLICHH